MRWVALYSEYSDEHVLPPDVSAMLCLRLSSSVTLWRDATFSSVLSESFPQSISFYPAAGSSGNFLVLYGGLVKK